jgi:hypothetical protein
MTMRELFCDTGIHCGTYWVDLRGYVTPAQLDALRRAVLIG